MIKYKKHDLDGSVKEKLLSLMKRLDLNYGAVDMIITPTGDHIFLELNPTGEFQWIEDFTGLKISDAIFDHLEAKLR